MNNIAIFNAPLPTYLNNREDNGLSEEIQDIVGFKKIKVVQGRLGLYQGKDNVGNKSLVRVGADGIREKVPDAMAFCIMGFSDIHYSYFGKDDDKPLCFSIGGTTPSSNARVPQSTKCKTCRQNTDGSGKDGIGKACSKHRFLFGFDIHDPEREIVMVQVPALSVYFNPENLPNHFGFNDYVKFVRKTAETNGWNIDIANVVTQISVSTTMSKNRGESTRLNFSVLAVLSEDDYKYSVTPDVIDTARKIKQALDKSGGAQDNVPTTSNPVASEAPSFSGNPAAADNRAAILQHMASSVDAATMPWLQSFATIGAMSNVIAELVAEDAGYQYLQDALDAAIRASAPRPPAPKPQAPKPPAPKPQAAKPSAPAAAANAPTPVVSDDDDAAVKAAMAIINGLSGDDIPF